MAATKKKKGNVKKRRLLKVFVFILEIILLLVVLAALYISLKMQKIDSGEKIDEEDLQINDFTPDVEEVMDKYTTIALFGLDNRSNGHFNQGNSDVIMLASINEKTKEVKLVSVYRDTYLDITDGKGYRKANAAYAYGGPEQAVNMLNLNLDLKIKDYVCFDFKAVSDAVDLLGGVEIELTKSEVKYINGYIRETSKITGKKSKEIPRAGTYLLDGVQATSYARIRYTAGGDFKRTERQRLVLEKMVEKALASDLGTINKLIDKIFPEIKTSFTNTEILLLAKDAFSYKLGENTGFPFDKGTGTFKKAGDCVVARDLESNVIKLHEFLFESEEYEVSSTVKRISREIVNNTGMTKKEEQQD